MGIARPMLHPVTMTNVNVYNPGTQMFLVLCLYSHVQISFFVTIQDSNTRIREHSVSDKARASSPRDTDFAHPLAKAPYENHTKQRNEQT